jgi:4-hydroxy-2-oxoheptanedioate aldolase
MHMPSIRSNHLKAKLHAGGTAFGTWIVMNRNPAIVRIAAASGFDFVFIDAEHGDFSWETVASLCDMARASDLVPIVRPSEANPFLANRIQDLGAMGLMYHDVRSRELVTRMLSAMRYPPDGSRGLTSFGASMDYLGGPGDELRRISDENSMLIVQIESRAGVENIDQILDGGGVDLVEIGRGDLSMSLGVPMQPKHARVVRAIEYLVERSERHSVAVGVNCVSIEDGAEMLDLGIRCISFSSDRRILQSAYSQAARALAGHTPASSAAGAGLSSSASGRIENG